MLVPFNTLSDHSKIWIYQSSRLFTDIEVNDLELRLSNFVENWESHSRTLKGAFLILENRFVVISVDETVNDASGCSIDKSVHFLQEIENEFKTQLLDKSKVAIKSNDGYVVLYPLLSLKEAVRLGEISQNTLVYNNLVSTKKDFETSWIVPVEATWLNKYFK
ncbi:MAG: hypothetical protein RLZZ175_1783 [Bacteroidota bacterium]|jgi:hypothetical protein